MADPMKKSNAIFWRSSFSSSIDSSFCSTFEISTLDVSTKYFSAKLNLNYSSLQKYSQTLVGGDRSISQLTMHVLELNI